NGTRRLTQRPDLTTGAAHSGADTVQPNGPSGPSVVLVAVLGFGLIRRWGEVVPGWVPRLGGRTIPPLVPIIVGGIRCAVLLGLIGSVLAKFVLAWMGTVPGWTPDVGMTVGERAFLLTCYIPFFLWPVAIASALIVYARRRLGTRPDRTRVRQGRAPIVC
ncbi:hypothetical protein, partial [Brevibacterium casei]|uniref:hypothetical protein n=1 Tax=Brevibacterium casei TaxID=33889 RepID=UPI0028AA0145